MARPSLRSSSFRPRRLSVESLERRELLAVAPASVFSLGGAALGSDLAHDVAVDRDGNTYLSGSYSETVDFDPGLGEHLLTSNGQRDIFVAKYAPDDTLHWVRSFGGPGVDNYTDAFHCCSSKTTLLVDRQGGSYILGTFQQTVAFDSVTLTADQPTSRFLLRLDASGGVSWAREFDLAALENIAIDDRAADPADWAVYLVGSFSGTQAFGSQTFNSVSGSSDGFLSRLDATSGTFESTRVTTGKGNEAFYGVALDPSGSGSLSIAGVFKGNAAIGSTSLKSSSGSDDGLVVKAALNGNFQWAKAIGTGSEFAAAHMIDVSNGQTFVAGRYYNRTTIGQINLRSSVSSNDSFAAKLDASGNVVWAKTVGDRASAEGGLEKYPRDFVADASGNLFFTGSFDSAMKLGSITLPDPAAAHDGFIAQLSQTNGTFLNAWRMGGSCCWNAINGLSLDANGNPVAAGQFQGVADFPDGTLLTAAGTLGDLFVLRLEDTASAAMTSNRFGSVGTERGAAINSGLVDATLAKLSQSDQIWSAVFPVEFRTPRTPARKGWSWR